MILRIQYKKIGNMKFISHLDMVKILERTFRRMGVPLKFSQGFNPHPKMAFAAPLSVGHASDGEVVDVEVTEAADIDSLIKYQRTYLPEGIEFVRAKHIEASKSLMSMVASAVYLVKFETDTPVAYDALEAAIQNLMAQKTVEIVKVSGEGRKRKEKTVDIRPYIYELEAIDADGDDMLLKLHISAGSTFNLKPEVVTEQLCALASLPMNRDSLRVHRLVLNGCVGEKRIDLYDMM